MKVTKLVMAISLGLNGALAVARIHEREDEPFPIY
jgi:hypothetical protein